MNLQSIEQPKNRGYFLGVENFKAGVWSVAFMISALII